MNTASQAFWSMIQYRLIRNQTINSELITNFKNSFQEPVSSSRLLTLLIYGLKFNHDLETPSELQISENIELLIDTIDNTLPAEKKAFYTACLQARRYFSLAEYENLYSIFPMIFNYECTVNTDEWFLKGNIIFSIIMLLNDPGFIEILLDVGFTNTMIEDILNFGTANAILHRDYGLSLASLN